MRTAILAIETSTEACSAALLLNNEIMHARHKLAPRQHAQLILPQINELLQEANLELTQLTAIAFSMGPGSFTGLRIAAGITQGLAFAANLKVIAVSSLRVLAQTAYRELGCEHVLVAQDARMGEIYWGCYSLKAGGFMQAVQPDTLCEFIDKKLPANYALCNWTQVGDAWQHENIIVLPHAEDLARLSYEEYLAGNVITPEQALPIYLRGEEAWQKSL